MNVAKKIFERKNWCISGSIQGASSTASIHYGTMTVPIKNIKLVALKVMDARDRPNETAFELASVRKLIDHQNDHVIRFIDTWEVQHNVCIAMEYLPRGDVHSYMEKVLRATLSENQARRLFHQTCLGVQFLHSKDIAHMDIKPENLLLDDHLNVRITDFDMSRTTGRIVSKPCGTVGFAPPEIYCKAPFWGAPVDIWTLGITLYCMVYGNSPFPDPFITSSDLPPSFPGVRRRLLRNFILDMIKYDPTRRPKIRFVLMDPWFQDGAKSAESPRAPVVGQPLYKAACTQPPQPRPAKGMAGKPRAPDQPKKTRAQRAKKRPSSGVSITSLVDELEHLIDQTPQSAATSTVRRTSSCGVLVTTVMAQLSQNPGDSGAADGLDPNVLTEALVNVQNSNAPRVRTETMIISSPLALSPSWSNSPNRPNSPTYAAELLEPDTLSISSLLAISPLEPDNTAPTTPTTAADVLEPNTNAQGSKAESMTISALLDLVYPPTMSNTPTSAAELLEPNTNAPGARSETMIVSSLLDSHFPLDSDPNVQGARTDGMIVDALLDLVYPDSDNRSNTASSAEPLAPPTDSPTYVQARSISGVVQELSSGANPPENITPEVKERSATRTLDSLSIVSGNSVESAISRSSTLSRSVSICTTFSTTSCSPCSTPSCGARSSPICTTCSTSSCSPRSTPSPRSGKRYLSPVSLVSSRSTESDLGSNLDSESWRSISIHLAQAKPKPKTQAPKKKSIWKRFRGFLRACLPLKKHVEEEAYMARK